MVAHCWAKRSRGAPAQVGQAGGLLALLEPMFEEQNTDVVKGVGWGLKRLDTYDPELVADWLAEQVVHCHRNHHVLMLRKALTYLLVEQRDQATGGVSR